MLGLERNEASSISEQCLWANLCVIYASVAQLVEQGTENPRVVGSIPTGGTKCLEVENVLLHCIFQFAMSYVEMWGWDSRQGIFIVGLVPTRQVTRRGVGLIPVQNGVWKNRCYFVC